MEIQLSDIDKKKIEKNHSYKIYKKWSQTAKNYKEFEVGTAVFIKRKSDNTLLSRGGFYSRSKSPPTKFIIIENDNGFLFAKRILATGGLGKDIICLTSDYGSERWELVPDDAMVDAMLLDEEYDPAAEAKELKKKKNKASRVNSKHRIAFNTAHDSYAFLLGLSPGDKLWTCDTTFGSNIAEYEVVKTTLREVKSLAGQRYIYGADKIDKYHDEEVFEKVLEVQLFLKNGGNRWSNTNKVIYFINICKKPDYRYYNEIWFNKKPVTTEDIA
jgi:hypothetical protein